MCILNTPFRAYREARTGGIMKTPLIAWASGGLLLLSCAGNMVAPPAGHPPPDAAAAGPATEPPGWAEGLALAPLADTNPDPHVVEVAIDARVAPVSFRPGTTTQAWT